jgi:hypothetical protein
MGMRSGRGPRANPAKTREWQQRSAAKAAERQRERGAAAERVDKKGRGPLKPGQIGDTSPPRAPRPDRRVEFRGPLLAGRSCCTCLARDRVRKAVHWHHWIAQQHLRAYVDSLRIRDDGQKRALLRRLLHDQRNLSPVCFDCHDAHEHRVNGPKFTAADVPDSAREFAAELGAMYVVRLEHDYR